MNKNDAQKGYDDREKGLPIPKNASEDYKDGWYTCHEEFAGQVGNDPLNPSIIVKIVYDKEVDK